MRANLDRQLSVSEMAEAVQLSPSHLSELFKAQTGSSLSRYRRDLRMQPPVDERVRTVVASMKANLHRKLPLAELAGAVRLSESHLRHLFKAETGTSLARYLRELRIRRAGELLETTFLSIKEVADRVGVQSLNHFVGEFKRVHGVTPREFTMRYRRTARAPVNRQIR